MDWVRRFNKERFGAVLVTVLGAAVAAQGTGYRMGQLTNMGAGFMPVVYGALMMLVGTLLFATARRSPDALGRPPEWRGWACIVGGVAAFVVLGRYGGFAPAAFASVFLSALGDRLNSVRDCALLALAVTVFGWLVFILALHMPLPCSDTASASHFSRITSCGRCSAC